MDVTIEVDGFSGDAEAAVLGQVVSGKVVLRPKNLQSASAAMAKAVEKHSKAVAKASAKAAKSGGGEPAHRQPPEAVSTFHVTVSCTLHATCVMIGDDAESLENAFESEVLFEVSQHFAGLAQLSGDEERTFSLTLPDDRPNLPSMPALAATSYGRRKFRQGFWVEYKIKVAASGVLGKASAERLLSVASPGDATRTAFNVHPAEGEHLVGGCCACGEVSMGDVRLNAALPTCVHIEETPVACVRLELPHVALEPKILKSIVLSAVIKCSICYHMKKRNVKRSKTLASVSIRPFPSGDLADLAPGVVLEDSGFAGLEDLPSALSSQQAGGPYAAASRGLRLLWTAELPAQSKIKFVSLNTKLVQQSSTMSCSVRAGPMFAVTAGEYIEVLLSLPEGQAPMLAADAAAALAAKENSAVVSTAPEPMAGM